MTNTLPAAIHSDAAERAIAVMAAGRGRAIVPIIAGDGVPVVAIEVESSESRIATREISRDDAETMLQAATARARNFGVAAEIRVAAMNEVEALESALTYGS